MSIVDSLKKLAVKLGRAQTPEEIYAPDITTALKQVAVGYGIADDPSKVPGSSIDDVIDVLADKIEPGGGSGIPFPEVTVTLNIDQAEDYCETVEIVSLLYPTDYNNEFGYFAKAYYVEPAPSQLIAKGGMLPDRAFEGHYYGSFCYGLSLDSVNVVAKTGFFYDLTASDAVNMAPVEEGDERNYKIVDVTKPASITVTATLISNQ